MSLFSKRKTEENSYSYVNPFLKKGDYIHLRSKNGRYKVTSIEEKGFYTLPDPLEKEEVPEFHVWEDFKRWSQKSNEESQK